MANRTTPAKLLRRLLGRWIPALLVCLLLGIALPRLWLDGEGDPSPVITLDEFDRIADGMSYEECVAIIGAAGTAYGATTAYSTPSEEAEWISYVWTNARDSSAEVSFYYGEVESKRAHGLR